VEATNSHEIAELIEGDVYYQKERGRGGGQKYWGSIGSHRGGHRGGHYNQIRSATETEWIMPLPSTQLLPLQLCQELTSFTVCEDCGRLITDLAFLENLPQLAELDLARVQILDATPLSTLPSLVRFFTFCHGVLRGLWPVTDRPDW
jgi:hypothetical protein